MSKIHSLDIYQNAIDSLNEGIEIYERALEDDSKYKFSVIIISNFMELLLKHMVELQNPLLIYEKPYSDKINKEKTITWTQAINILTNSGKIVNNKLIEDIKKLTDLRNNIIHFKFEYKAVEIDSIILSVIDGLCELFKNIIGKDIIIDVQENTKNILEKIKGDYLNELHQAQFNAKEESENDSLEILDCNYCYEEKTAVERHDGEIFCHFCGESDSLHECARCTCEYLTSDMEYFGETEDGFTLYLCDHCSGLLNED